MIYICYCVILHIRFLCRRYAIIYAGYPGKGNRKVTIANGISRNLRLCHTIQFKCSGCIVGIVLSTYFVRSNGSTIPHLCYNCSIAHICKGVIFYGNTGCVNILLIYSSCHTIFQIRKCICPDFDIGTWCFSNGIDGNSSCVLITCCYFPILERTILYLNTFAGSNVDICTAFFACELDFRNCYILISSKIKCHCIFNLPKINGCIFGSLNRNLFRSVVLLNFCVAQFKQNFCCF